MPRDEYHGLGSHIAVFGPATWHWYLLDPSLKNLNRLLILVGGRNSQPGQ